VLELTMQKTHSNQVVYLNVSKTTVFIAKTQMKEAENKTTEGVGGATCANNRGEWTT